MAKPSIFISSTYYDLKHIRSSLEHFVLSLGYEPILSEKGNIAYSSTQPLDESCYKQAKNCDIFVVIIGGRYGSEVSKSGSTCSSKEFYDQYDSVTKEEFESAYSEDIPVYVLIEKSVYFEYETYRNNSGNESINYAHVNSVNVFKFIEIVLSKPRNNPVFHFEKESEIEDWLKEQWAGLFKDMLAERLSDKRLTSLADKVSELENINSTLKNYMEVIMNQVSNDDTSVQQIIKEEQNRLENVRLNDKLHKEPVINQLVNGFRLPFDGVKEALCASSLSEFLLQLEKLSNGAIVADALIKGWNEDDETLRQINSVREILGKTPFRSE